MVRPFISNAAYEKGGPAKRGPPFFLSKIGAAGSALSFSAAYEMHTKEESFGDAGVRLSLATQECIQYPTADGRCGAEDAICDGGA